MAKNTKGGLGRGLNSLLSGSIEEASPVETKKTERDTVAFEDAETQNKKAPKPTTARKPLSQEQMQSAGQAPEPKQAQQVMPSAKNDVAEEGQKTASNKVEKRKESFVDEDDHVVIKEVKEREVKAKETDEAPLSSIRPNPDQPRTNFKQEEIEELAASIEKDGLLQPILVRVVGKEYQIIAGERRWQACKSLGMKTVPIRVREADDDKALELALVENIQRSDLNPIEEAYGYRRLMERKGLTQSEVAETVSKGRSTIANALRLLELPEDAQQLLFEEKISAGHARAILSIPTKEGRQKLTDRMVKEKISVREAEAIARLLSGAQNRDSSNPRPPTPKSFKNVARALRKALDTNVRVKTVQGKNKIEIEFKDEEELERLFGLISADENV